MTMEELTLRTIGHQFQIVAEADEPKGGLLGSLGTMETLELVPHACPECRLARLFAEE
jgi:hypothetical protein